MVDELSVPGDLKGQRVSLIGGAGFIGHHLALDLRSKGATVEVIDSLQVNHLLSLLDSDSAPAEKSLYECMLRDRLRLLEAARIPLHLDDARDYHRMSYRLASFEPHVIILLAAVSHASRANKDPMTTLDHCFRSLENVLDFARGTVAKRFLQRFIFFSSSMVYGNFNDHSVSESDVCEPIGIYGAVKLGSEKLITAYGNVFDVPYTIVRPSALYGERCISRRVGQIFIENALRGTNLVVQGDGEDHLDFTYVGDLVQGVHRIIDNESAESEVFNLTYGQAHSLNYVAQIVNSEFPGITIQHSERSSLVPERGTLDISKARQLLGYSPSFPVDMGFRRYIEWYRELQTQDPSLFQRGVGHQTNE